MKLNKIAALLAVAGMSAPAFATNGDNLIGLGVQSRALGGTGTAAYYGAENALTNPALLGKLKGTEFSFAATAFMPDVKATTNVATFPGLRQARRANPIFTAFPRCHWPTASITTGSSASACSAPPAWVWTTVAMPACLRPLPVFRR